MRHSSCTKDTNTFPCKGRRSGHATIVHRRYCLSDAFEARCVQMDWREESFDSNPATRTIGFRTGDTSVDLFEAVGDCFQTVVVER